MDDLLSSDELEEENIFQKARIPEGRKRSPSESNKPPQIKPSKLQRHRGSPLRNETVEQDATHALHPVSLSSSPDPSHIPEIAPPSSWNRPNPGSQAESEFVIVNNSQSVQPSAELDVLQNLSLPGWTTSTGSEAVLNRHTEQQFPLNTETADTDTDTETVDLEIGDPETVDPQIGDLETADLKIAHTERGRDDEIRALSSDFGDTTSDLMSDLGSEDHVVDIIPQDLAVSSAGRPSHPQTTPHALTNPHLQTIGELLAKLPFIEVPLLDSALCNINISTPLSRSDSIKLDLIKSDIVKLRERSQNVAESLQKLQSTPLSLSREDDGVAENEVIKQIWTSSVTLARVSALKIESRQLQAFRLRLMQEIVDLKYSAGVNTASERAYDQLKLQINEAKQALVRAKKYCDSTKELREDVESIQHKVHELQERIRAKEEEFRILSEREVAKIKNEIFGRTRGKDGSGVSEEEKAVEQRIEQNCAIFGAKVTYGGKDLTISLLYMSLNIDVETHAFNLEFHTPPVIKPFFKYFEALVVQGCSHRPFNSTLKLWETCLGIKTHLISMLTYGPYSFEYIMKDPLEGPDILIFRQRHTKRKGNIVIKFNGPVVTIGEAPLDLRDLPPLRGLLKYSLVSR